MNLLRIYSFYNFEFTYQEEREVALHFTLRQKSKQKLFVNLNTRVKVKS